MKMNPHFLAYTSMGKKVFLVFRFLENLFSVLTDLFFF